MPKFRWTDILVELIELCHERMQELRQQLVYYRASVYKAETLAHISAKIEQLHLISGLLGDELVGEAFTDYEEMAKDGAVNYIPGECSLSHRLTMLLGTLDGHLGRVSGQLASRALPDNETEFADSVRKHRTLLLALCRHGSRQYAFFQSL